MTGECVIYLFISFAIAYSTESDLIRYQTPGRYKFNKTCNLTLANESIRYFHSRLYTEHPNLIYLYVKFYGSTPNYTEEVFYPYKWVWTYATSKDVYPYIHWNIDYDIFSFDLLNVKTINIPFIYMYQTESCNLTLGTPATSELIADSLKTLIFTIKESLFDKYQHSYWCFMAEVPGVRKTMQYYLGLYLDYPVTFIKYNCCIAEYQYETQTYEVDCPDRQINVWSQCTIFPYIFGILLFLYSPIIKLEIYAYLSTSEKIKGTCTDSFELSETSPIINENRQDSRTELKNEENDDSNWIYLNGTAPLSFSGIFRGLFKDTRPILYSRFRRFVCVLLAPIVIYIKLVVYGFTHFKITDDLMNRGFPFGFLSLLANTTKGRSKTFVPALGGPISIVLTFYLISIIFFVFPTSVKKIVQDGLPSSRCKYFPLCFNAAQVKQLSQIQVKDDPGYKNAANHLRCSCYMLFSSIFWKRVFSIQKKRFIKRFLTRKTAFNRLLVCLFPLYIFICIIETFIAILFYSIPFLGLIVIMVRGATQYLANKIGRSGRASAILLRSKVLVVSSVVLLAALMTFYAYCVCLVFLESWIFLSEFFIYSYFAVIIYPAISFGYLFFAAILAYYILRLIRGFGNRYLELLNDIVEISLNIDQHDNHVINFDGNLIISNVKISEIKSITINDKVLPVSTNMQHSFSHTTNMSKNRIRFRDNAYGIRKDLFKFVISKHLPVHQQVLKVFFQLSCIFLFLLFTISLTGGPFTGPTSQITEVLHVMFILTVGAMPRVLEVALSDSNEHIERELKMRSLEKTVCQFWRSNACGDML